MMTTTPIMTTTLKTTTTTTTVATTTLVTTTTETTTLVTTTPPTTTLLTTTIPTTTLSTLRTTLMKLTSQPFKTPINSLHVSSMFINQSTKTTTTQKEETSATLEDIETTTIFTTHFTLTQTTTQGHSTTVQINATSKEGSGTPLKPTEILYLILGISVAEFALIASGICIIKRRQKEPSKQTHRELQVDKVRPISRKSVMSVANVYESIPLEHFSNDDIMEEDEKGGVYVDLPEHVYDRSFVKRTRANGNTNFYALISELKNKKA
nr:hepatitis A virus cellular receptor 1-like isoform X2 [Crassostrea virginica]